MMVTVQLDPELQTRLLAEARAQGVSLEAYLTTVIAQAGAREGPHETSLTGLEAALNELAEGSEALPVLPPEAYHRDSIYGDE